MRVGGEIDARNTVTALHFAVSGRCRRMMLRPWILAVLAVAALCSACTEEWTGWDDVPTATLTPTAPAAHHAEWSAYVADQVSMWASVLTPLGCPTPFVVGEGGHVTELVETKDWSYDEGIAAILRAPVTLQVMAGQLIDAANAKGGRDNISVLLAQANTGSRKRSLFSRMLGK